MNVVYSNFTYINNICYLYNEQTNNFISTIISNNGCIYC